MKKYKAYLIDLDGTIYRGDSQIKTAVEFVNTLHNKEVPYLFVTNNSASTQREISSKLNEMGVYSTPKHIITSGLAIAKYIKKEKPNARCLVIGESGLFDALEKENLTISDSKHDYVIMGIDRDITYEKFTQACLAVRKGAKFISTNSDKAIPTERGLIPGNGALTSVVSVSTGVHPLLIGKPEAIIIEEALTFLDFLKEDILMVGDNYHTDILAGINANLDTLLTFTGITQYDDLSNISKKPTYYVNNLSEWIDNI